MRKRKLFPVWELTQVALSPWTDSAGAVGLYMSSETVRCSSGDWDCCLPSLRTTHAPVCVCVYLCLACMQLGP